MEYQEAVDIKSDITIHSVDWDIEFIHGMEVMVFGSHQSTPEKIDYVKRNNPLLLVAFDGEQSIGFKLGYVIPDTRYFFSWLGGVHKSYRRLGIAGRMLKSQEAYARERNMEKIYFTTFDRFQAMIALGKKSGYCLAKTEKDNGELKYWYEKHL